MSKVKNPNDSKKRTSKDAFLIESLKTVVDGIGKTFGARCEVVLHDLRHIKNYEHSIIKIINGHVTGRTVGGPLSDRGLKDIKSGTGWDLSINYASKTREGRLLKSSTMVFRNERGKPIASLCINFDIADILSLNAVIQDIFGFQDDIQNIEPVESFSRDAVATLSDVADKIIRRSGKTTTSMGRQDKIEVVRQLEEQGFFLIKGSIKLIAGKLMVSKYTVYNYLEYIRSQTSESTF